MSLQTQLSGPLGSWCRWQEGKTRRFSIKSLRCLYLLSPGTHTIICVVIVQCWLETQGWWQFTNGTCPCTSCLQSWICSVFLEHAWRVDVLLLSLSCKQLDLTVMASIPLPVLLWPCKYLPVQIRDALNQPPAPCRAGTEDWVNIIQLQSVNGAEDPRVDEEEPSLIMSVKDRSYLSTKKQQDSGRGRGGTF